MSQLFHVCLLLYRTLTPLLWSSWPRNVPPHSFLTSPTTTSTWPSRKQEMPSRSTPWAPVNMLTCRNMHVAITRPTLWTGRVVTGYCWATPSKWNGVCIYNFLVIHTDIPYSGKIWQALNLVIYAKMPYFSIWWLLNLGPRPPNVTSLLWCKPSLVVDQVLVACNFKLREGLASIGTVRNRVYLSGRPACLNHEGLILAGFNLAIFPHTTKSSN